MVRALSLAATIAAAALGLTAAPAGAAIYVGSEMAAPPDKSDACAGCAAVLRQSAGTLPESVPVDGVIVRWWVRTASASPVTFHAVRREGTGYRRVGGATAATTSNSAQSFVTRIPVSRGDQLGLSAIAGAIQSRDLVSGSYNRLSSPPVEGSVTTDGGGFAGELPVGADVEVDADHDGFGDETQDECPGDAGLREAPCSGIRVGPGLLPAGTFSSLVIGEITSVTRVGPGAAVVPADGVVVRWRYRGRGGSLAMQVLRPEGGTTVRNVAQAPFVPEPAGGQMIRTVPASVPVKAGDAIGLRYSDATLWGYHVSGAVSSNISPPPAPGATATDPGGVNGIQYAINADVEPDADGDGRGDQTQDGCPTDPAVSGACPPPPPPPSPPTSAPSQSTTVTVTQVVPRIIRPGTARLAVRRLRYRGTRALSVPLTCPADAESCRGLLELKVAKRAAGRQAFSLRPGQRRAVNVKLTARARRALRRGGKVSARIVPAGPSPTNGSLTLTR